jgi:hypothetical protein
MLLEMGIGFDDLEDVKAAIAGVGVVVTPRDAVEFTFAREIHPVQRYNTEAFPVFYSALMQETCVAEILHHLAASIGVGHARYYHFVEVQFSGMALDLCGHEGDHPELISASSAGYPFCQQLASMARLDGIDAFYAPSARHEGGVCVPVFYRHALTEPQITGSLRFYSEGPAVTYERIV